MGGGKKKTQKNNALYMYARTHTRTHEQNLMGKCGASRLDFTLRFQLPAGSCYQPHSRAHVRDRLTPERASALTERKLLQQQRLHPRQNTLPLPLRSVAPQPCTPLVFLLFLLSAERFGPFFFFFNMCRTILTEKRRHFLNKSPDTREALWSDRVERCC